MSIDWSDWLKQMGKDQRAKPIEKGGALVNHKSPTEQYKMAQSVVKEYELTKPSSEALLIKF